MLNAKHQIQNTTLQVSFKFKDPHFWYGIVITKYRSTDRKTKNITDTSKEVIPKIPVITQFHEDIHNLAFSW